MFEIRQFDERYENRGQCWTKLENHSTSNVSHESKAYAPSSRRVRLVIFPISPGIVPVRFKLDACRMNEKSKEKVRFETKR